MVLLQLGTPLQEQTHKRGSCWVIMLNHCQELKTVTDSFLLLPTSVKADTMSLLFKLLQSVRKVLSTDGFLLEGSPVSVAATLLLPLHVQKSV